MEKKPVKKSFTAPSLTQKKSHDTTTKLSRGEGESKKEFIPKKQFKKDKQESLPEKAKAEKHLTDSQYAALFDAVLAKAAHSSQDPCSEDEEDECFKALESEDMDNSDIENTENTVQLGDKSSQNKQERSVTVHSSLKKSPSTLKEEQTFLSKVEQQVTSRREPAPKKQFKFFNNQERKSAASYAYKPGHAHVHKHKKAKLEPIYKPKMERHHSHSCHRQNRPITSKTSCKELMLNREFIESGTWVQCDIPSCQKWRHLKDVQDPMDVPEKWTCMLNTEENYNSCSKPEESWDESEHQEKFIYTRYTEGSVVWAKIAGFPWWPAMIEMDPDTGSFFEVEMQNSMLPTSYHVVFFDNKVSRAWIRASFVKSFTGNEVEHIDQRSKVNQSYKKEVGVAKTMAIKALSQPIQDRVKQYSFSKRFTGKWAHLENSESSVEEPSQDIKKRNRKRKCSVDCSDELLDEFLQDAEVVLQNVEDALGSMEEELFSDGSSYILSSPGVKNKLSNGFKHKGSMKDDEEKENIPPNKTSKTVMTNHAKNIHVKTKKPARPLPESEGVEIETTNIHDKDGNSNTAKFGTLINDSLDEESCKSEGDMDDMSYKADKETDAVDRSDVEGNEREAENNDKGSKSGTRNDAGDNEIEDSQTKKIEGEDDSSTENVPIDGGDKKDVYGSNDGNTTEENELSKSHKVRPGIKKADIVKDASPRKNKQIIEKEEEKTIVENRESKENKKKKKGKKLVSTKRKTQNRKDNEMSDAKQDENTETEASGMDGKQDENTETEASGMDGKQDENTKTEASGMDGKQEQKEPAMTTDATKDLVSTKKNKASKKKGKMRSKSIVEETCHVINVKGNMIQIEELAKENCDSELVIERVEKTDRSSDATPAITMMKADESRNKKKSKKSAKRKKTEERNKDTGNSSSEKMMNKKVESTKENKSSSMKREQQKSDNKATSQASEDDSRSVSNDSMKSSQMHSQKKKSKGMFSAPKPIAPQSRVKEDFVIIEPKTKENIDRVVPKEFEDEDDMMLDIETVDNLIEESSKKANICDNDSDSDPFELED